MSSRPPSSTRAPPVWMWKRKNASPAARFTNTPTVVTALGFTLRRTRKSSGRRSNLEIPALQADGCSFSTAVSRGQDDPALLAGLDSLRDLLVDAHHQPVEVGACRLERLVVGAGLHGARGALVLVALGGAGLLPLLHGAGDGLLQLAQPVDGRHRLTVVGQPLVGALERLVLVALRHQPADLARLVPDDLHRSPSSAQGPGSRAQYSQNQTQYRYRALI